MRRRSLLAAVTVALGTLGIACVDLFHDTDFETLCARAPDDPQCGGDADAASASDAGRGSAVGARRPHPDFCAWSSDEARSRALRACAWLGACEGPLGESAFGPCVVRAQLAYDCAANPTLRPAGSADEFWSCLSTASTCGEIDACVFPQGVEPCPTVDGGSFSTCGGRPGSPRVRCVAGPEQRASGVEPCMMSGTQCAVADPSRASCGGSAGFDCATTGCKGSSAVDCTIALGKGFDQGIDCASVGAGACLVDDAGQPFCAPNATALSCTDDETPVCFGNVAQACLGGRTVRVDCTKLDLSCDVGLLVPIYDVAAACKRRAGNNICAAADRCADGRITSCGRGGTYAVDCASIGLKDCVIKDGRAACSPP